MSDEHLWSQSVAMKTLPDDYCANDECTTEPPVSYGTNSVSAPLSMFDFDSLQERIADLEVRYKALSVLFQEASEHKIFRALKAPHRDGNVRDKDQSSFNINGASGVASRQSLEASHDVNNSRDEDTSTFDVEVASSHASMISSIKEEMCSPMRNATSKLNAVIKLERDQIPKEIIAAYFRQTSAAVRRKKSSSSSFLSESPPIETSLVPITNQSTQCNDSKRGNSPNEISLLSNASTTSKTKRQSSQLSRGQNKIQADDQPTESSSLSNLSKRSTLPSCSHSSPNMSGCLGCQRRRLHRLWNQRHPYKEFGVPEFGESLTKPPQNKIETPKTYRVCLVCETESASVQGWRCDTCKQHHRTWRRYSVDNPGKLPCCPHTASTVRNCRGCLRRRYERLWSEYYPNVDFGLPLLAEFPSPTPPVNNNEIQPKKSPLELLRMSEIGASTAKFCQVCETESASVRGWRCGTCTHRLRKWRRYSVDDPGRLPCCSHTAPSVRNCIGCLRRRYERLWSEYCPNVDFGLPLLVELPSSASPVNNDKIHPKKSPLELLKTSKIGAIAVKFCQVCETENASLQGWRCGACKQHLRTWRRYAVESPKKLPLCSHLTSTISDCRGCLRRRYERLWSEYYPNVDFGLPLLAEFPSPTPPVNNDKVQPKKSPPGLLGTSEIGAVAIKFCEVCEAEKTSVQGWRCGTCKKRLLTWRRYAVESPKKLPLCSHPTPTISNCKGCLRRRYERLWEMYRPNIGFGIPSLSGSSPGPQTASSSQVSIPTKFASPKPPVCRDQFQSPSKLAGTCEIKDITRKVCQVCETERSNVKGWRCSTCKERLLTWRQYAVNCPKKLPKCSHPTPTISKCRGCLRRRYERLWVMHHPTVEFGVPSLSGTTAAPQTASSSQAISKRLPSKVLVANGKNSPLPSKHKPPNVPGIRAHLKNTAPLAQNDGVPLIKSKVTLSSHSLRASNGRSFKTPTNYCEVCEAVRSEVRAWRCTGCRHKHVRWRLLALSNPKKLDSCSHSSPVINCKGCLRRRYERLWFKHHPNIDFGLPRLEPDLK